MKQVKMAAIVVSLIAGTITVALAQSAPGGVNARDGSGNTSGATATPSANGAKRAAPRATNGSPSSADVRGASQTPSDPATIGTSGRDKQTGAPKDKD